MCASRLQFASHDGCDRLSGTFAGQDLSDGVVGDGGFAARNHGHALAVPRMPADRRINAAGARLRYAADDGQIVARQGPVGELSGQRNVGLVCLRDDHQAAGVTIKPVHDPRAAYAADPGQ